MNVEQSDESDGVLVSDLAVPAGIFSARLIGRFTGSPNENI